MIPESTEAPPSAPPNADWLAWAALVLGILSCALSCLTGIPAIVLGALAYQRASPSARPFGMVGLGLGAFNTFVALLVTLAVVVAGLLGQSLVGDFEKVQPLLREVEDPEEPEDDT